MTLFEAYQPIRYQNSTELAAFFAGLGIKGKRACPFHCIVAEYLTRCVGEPIEVGTLSACVTRTIERVRLTENVRAFIHNFDSGCYPELEAA